MALSIEEIRGIFARHGGLAYSGEPVSQLEHALQCAQLAEQDGAPDALVVAALLHDLGHLLHPRVEARDTPTEQGVDDLHQYYALPFLRANFPDAVLEPIRLHVDAKRCLCAIDPEYFSRLSPDSVRSLALQGGVFDTAQAAAFRSQPYAEDAMRLRRWDDLAKVADCATPPLDYYLAMTRRLVEQHTEGRDA